jgi:hypothetical protein
LTFSAIALDRRVTRPYFMNHRELLGKLCHAAYEAVHELMAAAAPGRLVLSYVPAGLVSGLLMSGVGLVLLALGAWRFRPTGADRQLQWLQASRYSDDSDHSGRT